jgi:hypothetical protein
MSSKDLRAALGGTLSRRRVQIMRKRQHDGIHA